jgi:acetylornithine deacetylase/succinyl-diaminopimelate desuccinylase-like protein
VPATNERDPLAYAAANEQRFLDELSALLRIPSISALSAHQADVERCAAFVAEHLRALGLPRVEIWPTARHPAVYAAWTGAPGKPTLLVYGHYDVQPVDPLDEWTAPPFEPTVRDGQLFARGAVDDKGQFFIHLKALEAHLRTRGALPLNVKLLIEGEEEIGSPNLEALIRQRQAELVADVAVISDTNMFAPGLPSLTYGLRGLMYAQIDLQGPRSDLHSGSFGGAVANPILVLARLLAGLHDAQGRVAVPGFYDDVRPLSEAERQAYAQLPFDEEAFRRELGVDELAGEAGYTVLERLWARPTLDANGVWGGFQGEGAKTVLPARAGAKISARLVPDQDPARIADLVEAHLRATCPRGVRMTFTRLHGGKPVLTPLDHPAVQAAARALEIGFGRPPVFIREGGTIPVVATLDEVLGVPTVLMGIGLPDGHAHAPDERLDLGNFFGGIRSAIALLDALAEALGRA